MTNPRTDDYHIVLDVRTEVASQTLLLLHALRGAQVVEAEQRPAGRGREMHGALVEVVVVSRGQHQVRPVHPQRTVQQKLHLQLGRIPLPFELEDPGTGTVRAVDVALPPVDRVADGHPVVGPQLTGMEEDPEDTDRRQTERDHRFGRGTPPGRDGLFLGVRATVVWDVGHPRTVAAWSPVP